MLELTSVNYLKLPWVPWEDDNVGTRDGLGAGDAGWLVGSCSCSMLGVCATPRTGPSAARLVLGTGLTPPQEPAWGCDPGAGGGDVPGTGEECVAPPART